VSSHSGTFARFQNDRERLESIHAGGELGVKEQVAVAQSATYLYDEYSIIQDLN
jgi:hypothetical protein